MRAQRSVNRVVCALLAIVVLTVVETAQAQSLGTFRWQLQPYCNVVSVTVTQAGAVYTLDGYDDLCGAPTRAPLVGLATPNPDGTIGFGLNISTVNGQPVQVAATITLAGLSGTWRDSAGQTGTFAFGAAAAGGPRPPVTPAAGGVTTGVSNTFTVPQTFAAGLNAGGARVQGVGAPAAATDATSKAYVDAADAATMAAAQAADTSILALIPPTNQFLFNADGGFLVKSGQGGQIPASGFGNRVLWHPGKHALRAGGVQATQWDDVNTGSYSMALGLNSTASGDFSTALGINTLASGGGSLAAGNSSQATGTGAMAIGYGARAGDFSFATGYSTIATGPNSTVMGSSARAGGGAAGSFVYGDNSTFVSLDASRPNEFLVRAAGGVTFLTNALMSSGVNLPAGGGAWVNLSDVARKQSFRDLDGETVLGKLRAMPIREWSYIAQGDGIRHVGPTAQDFRAAFGLGEDPLGISTVDADGIALAGVKALEARTATLADENASLRKELVARTYELQALQDRLAALEESLRARPRP